MSESFLKPQHPGGPKITREELLELFGPMLPIEVAMRLCDPGNMSRNELRAWMKSYKAETIELAKMWGDPKRTPYVGTHQSLMKYDISYNSDGSVKEPRCKPVGYSDNYNGMWK